MMETQVLQAKCLKQFNIWRTHTRTKNTNDTEKDTKMFKTSSREQRKDTSSTPMLHTFIQEILC